MTINFDKLLCSDFKRLASNPSLSKYQMIGFPDSYREGFELNIFGDIVHKLKNLEKNNAKVLDIGPGCSDLPLFLVELCKSKGHKLSLIDCVEMLDLLPCEAFIEKLPAQFPECDLWIGQNQGIFDVILCYSVFHYIFLESNLYKFLDSCLSLLAPGGQLLIGDIPNVSMRKRFFSSGNGVNYHRAFMKTDDPPSVVFNNIEFDKIDDTVILSLLQRCRLQGFDAYVMPQHPMLPLSNRREDILVYRP